MHTLFVVHTVDAARVNLYLAVLEFDIFGVRKIARYVIDLMLCQAEFCEAIAILYVARPVPVHVLYRGVEEQDAHIELTQVRRDNLFVQRERIAGRTV